MRDGHPETLAMRNDLARTLLPLFVPWEDLSLFDNAMGICGDGCNATCDGSTHTGLQACAMAWAEIKDSLPDHARDHAWNVDLLRKLKEDAKVDLAEQTTSAAAL